MDFFKKHSESILFVISFLPFIFFATYKLNQIPGEWFGDTSIGNDYILQIFAGHWPYIFDISAGPVYYYLISPIILFLGISFLNYKIASVFVGALGLFFVYIFSREVASKRIAFLTTVLTGISFWYVVWSRLGNLNIISPVISALTMYFLVAYIKKRTLRLLICGVLASSLGLFAYPGVFVLPIIFFVLVAFSEIRREKIVRSLRRIVLIGVAYIPAFILFCYIITQDINNFTKGYVGSKLFNIFSFSIAEQLSRFATNTYRTLAMFHFEGDIVFRWNVEKAPHLDVISGILFIVGLIYCIAKKQKYLVYLLVPLFLLSFPSVLPGHPPSEIPSSTRTLGIIPIVFIFVAYGVEAYYLTLLSLFGRRVGQVSIAVILILILAINCNKYFVVYPKGLPDNNIPFGKIIAQYISSLPQKINVRFASCCWGEWGQPEIDSIYYSQHILEKRENILSRPFIKKCSEVGKKENVVIIFGPTDTTKIEYFRKCFEDATVKSHGVNKQIIFYSLTRIF